MQKLWSSTPTNNSLHTPSRPNPQTPTQQPHNIHKHRHRHRNRLIPIPRKNYSQRNQMDSTNTNPAKQYHTDGSQLCTQTTPFHETPKLQKDSPHRYTTNRLIHMGCPKTTKSPPKLRRFHPANNTPNRTNKFNENPKPCQPFHKNPKPHPRYNPHNSTHKQNHKSACKQAHHKQRLRKHPKQIRHPNDPQKPRHRSLLQTKNSRSRSHTCRRQTSRKPFAPAKICQSNKKRNRQTLRINYNSKTHCPTSAQRVRRPKTWRVPRQGVRFC